MITVKIGYFCEDCTAIMVEVIRNTVFCEDWDHGLRFISRSTDKCKPFFQALKKNETDFRWNEECETAFQGLRKYLASTSLLSKPTAGEMLFLYLAVSESVVSLVREAKGIQKSVYYISYFMNGPQTRYQRLKKLVLALFIISSTTFKSFRSRSSQSILWKVL